jgi:formate hydrogenlyase transcriptional activator
LEALKTYPWPGNIRELENLIERSLVLATGNVIKDILLPDPRKIKAVEVHEDAYCKTIDENERGYIIGVLKKCNGKISGEGGTAEILGIPSTTLHSKMKKLGINKEQSFNN